MDHILLEPKGYQQALVETVLRIGRSLGFQDVRLTPQDISHFEAAGSTSEWDTAAICSALLLKQVWIRHPRVRLPSEPGATVVPPHDLPAPDMQAFARALAQPGLTDATLWAGAVRLLTSSGDGLSTDQHLALLAILRNARRFERSLTFRMFQELVLGSQAFSQAYQTHPRLQVEGTLERFDRPTLKPETHRRLIAWLDHPHHAAAILTNRPSMAPDGGSGTPEAETGAQIAGLDHLPIVGLGALSWRSALDGLMPEAYLKPSPVHTLTGLLLALGEPVEPALETAVALAQGGRGIGWERMAGAQVWVFEDAAKELRSALGAKQALAAQGVNFKLYLCGVTTSAPKKEALLVAGARVYSGLNAALTELPD